MAHVVSAVHYVEGVIRDAAFFLQEIQRYNNSLARWFAVPPSGRLTRDQCPTHAAKGKRSRLFTFNVDVDG